MSGYEISQFFLIGFQALPNTEYKLLNSAFVLLDINFLSPTFDSVFRALAVSIVHILHISINNLNLSVSSLSKTNFLQKPSTTASSNEIEKKEGKLPILATIINEISCLKNQISVHQKIERKRSKLFSSKQ